ncbi:hypothetical protein PF010_g30938 [Phytophthora fragariae]|uniref:Uncharacterized protein n=1 Tax=Phytophthora fragariae TaxID=53985 RepID=A0A6G0JIZ4_9STRA|nr:hypothetical protein PF010_g30938 [Phytophthora fragariae]
MSRRKKEALPKGPVKRQRTNLRSQSVSEPPLPKNESVAFKDAWAVLYRAGWTSKRANGRSLDLRYRYVRPGGDPNGKEGDDFLLGEQAVTNYYRRMYCVENSDNVVGNDCGGGDERADEFRPEQLDGPNEDADRNAWRSVVSAANAICSSGGHELPVPETNAVCCLQGGVL